MSGLYQLWWLLCISQSNNNHLMALCGWNVAALISVCDQLVLMALTTHKNQLCYGSITYVYMIHVILSLYIH